MIHWFWQSERGFAMMELVWVILIMMVLFAIASSTWFDAVESRRVDSATNELVADLRLAHTKATNRLANQTVTLTAGNSEYTLPGGATEDLDDNYDPGPAGDVVSVAANSTIVFKGDGTAQVTGANPITVRATVHPANNHTIKINPVTSEIKIVP